MSDRDDHATDAVETLGMSEFRDNMVGVMRQVRRGRSFLVTSHGEVVAELHPPSTKVRSRRSPGALRGKIEMAADFDVLPPALLAALEGDEA